MKNFFVAMMAISTAVTSYAHTPTNPNMRFVQIEAKTKEDRSKIADLGISIEFTRSDSVWGFADAESLKDLQKSKIKILGNFDMEVARGGHQMKAFPRGDERFHDYAELKTALQALETAHPNNAKVHIIGKSLEGRDIMALQLNNEPASLARGQSNKPGAIFMGNHHAREHLSLEIPLMMAQWLLANKEAANVKPLLEGRDIWFIPMVNPDGAEYDISGNNYKMWRKNRRNNGNGTWGVDLNRNYGYQWGTGGSSSSGSSDTYMGPTPFSEPETQVIKRFVESHLNAKILLSFHTFSELILYPWGHKYDGVENTRDRQVFEKMATTMAAWNKYKPQQSSDLYIASGDTVDWAYGEHNMFAFTFELSPSSMWAGGFYPGARAIDPTFNANLKPVLYLIDAADNPYKVLDAGSKSKFDMHPFPKL